MKRIKGSNGEDWWKPDQTVNGDIFQTPHPESFRILHYQIQDWRLNKCSLWHPNISIKKSQMTLIRYWYSMAASATVRNLCIWFHRDLSLNSHVWRSIFFIAKVRNFLSQSDAESLGHTITSSRLDNCNLLLFDCPNESLKSLQLVQNAAAWVLPWTRKRDHISPVYASPRRLPEYVLKSSAYIKLFMALHPYRPTRVLLSQNVGWEVGVL